MEKLRLGAVWKTDVFCIVSTNCITLSNITNTDQPRNTGPDVCTCLIETNEMLLENVQLFSSPLTSRHVLVMQDPNTHLNKFFNIPPPLPRIRTFFREKTLRKQGHWLGNGLAINLKSRHWEWKGLQMLFEVFPNQSSG